MSLIKAVVVVSFQLAELINVLIVEDMFTRLISAANQFLAKTLWKMKKMKAMAKIVFALNVLSRKTHVIAWLMRQLRR